MRFILVVFAALVVTVTAQDPDDFPLCAQVCAAEYVDALDEDSKTSCASDLATCVCSPAFQQGVLDCSDKPITEGGCSSEERDTTLEIYKRNCSASSGSEPAGPSETAGASSSNSVGGPSGSNSGGIAPTRTHTVSTPSVTTPPSDTAFRMAADADVGIILAAAVGLVLAL